MPLTAAGTTVPVRGEPGAIANDSDTASTFTGANTSCVHDSVQAQPAGRVQPRDVVQDHGGGRHGSPAGATATPKATRRSMTGSSTSTTPDKLNFGVTSERDPQVVHQPERRQRRQVAPCGGHAVQERA